MSPLSSHSKSEPQTCNQIQPLALAVSVEQLNCNNLPCLSIHRASKATTAFVACDAPSHAPAGPANAPAGPANAFANGLNNLFLDGDFDLDFDPADLLGAVEGFLDMLDAPGFEDNLNAAHGGSGAAHAAQHALPLGAFLQPGNNGGGGGLDVSFMAAAAGAPAWEQRFDPARASFESVQTLGDAPVVTEEDVDFRATELHNAADQQGTT